MYSYALINKNTLKFIREQKAISFDYVNRMTKYATDRMKVWEDPASGKFPTINQAKAIAKCYHVPFAGLYMNPEDIDVKKLPRMHNLRTMPAAAIDDSELNLAIIDVMEAKIKQADIKQYADNKALCETFLSIAPEGRRILIKTIESTKKELYRVNVMRLEKFNIPLEISRSQLVDCLVDMDDAEENLSVDEFSHIKPIYNRLKSYTSLESMDCEIHSRYCKEIISEFEKVVPFLLIDGLHSHAMELRDKLQAYVAHMDGVPYIQAKDIYQSYFDEQYKNGKFVGLRYAPFRTDYMDKVCLIVINEADAMWRYLAPECSAKMVRQVMLSLFYGLTNALGKVMLSLSAEQMNKSEMYCKYRLAERNSTDEYINSVISHREKFTELIYAELITLDRIEGQIDLIVDELIEKPLKEIGAPTNRHAEKDWIKRVIERIQKEIPLRNI